jgi:hypothetical protein
MTTSSDCECLRAKARAHFAGKRIATSPTRSAVPPSASGRQHMEVNLRCSPATVEDLQDIVR